MVPMPRGRCPPVRHHPKPPEASENQDTANLEVPGWAELAAGWWEHPARIFQVSGEVCGGSVCGKLGAALPALPMVLASAVECFTCMSTESKNKMTFIRCFKECSAM